MFAQEGSFEVGEKEKSIVSFVLSRWSGRFSVKINGIEVPQIKNVSMVSGPFSAEVGEKEKHTVTFQIIFPTLFAAFRKSTIQVLIDNKLHKTL